MGSKLNGGLALAFAVCVALFAPIQAHGQSADVAEPQMIVVPAGHFVMGSSAAETAREAMPDRYAEAERPVQDVEIRSFALAKVPVNRGEFARFVRDTGFSAAGCTQFDGAHFAKNAGADWLRPGFPQTDAHPVVCVGWNDARDYIAWLSAKTGRQYRLPSEAEWEYAARSGTITARYWGDGAPDQCRYGNGADQAFARHFPQAIAVTRNCSDGYVFTAPAGSFKPNAWGLYDMLGNVWQWTADCWNGSHEGAPEDGSARLDGDCARHVLRGGSWTNDPRALRAAARVGFDAGDRTDDAGFRLARSLP